MNDGRIKTESNFNTFCSLCTKKINKNEECYSYTTVDSKGKTHERLFMIHLDCKDEEVRTRMTLGEFRRTTKGKGNKKKKTPRGAYGINRNKLFYGS